MPVALELQYAVDNVFQNFRTGDAALLGDVSDEEDCHTALFGKLHQGSGTFANLGDAAGRGIHHFRGHRLYGVDDEQRGLQCGGIFQHLVDVAFAIEQGLVPGFGLLEHPVGAEFDLPLAFFAADVEDACLAHLQDGLEQECGFPDTRFAA